MTNPKTSPVAESVVELLYRRLRDGDDAKDGWTDYGMEGAFFRWEVIDRELRAAIAAMPRSIEDDTPTDAGEGVEYTALDAWQELVEYDDRTSPEEYPDMALITFEELKQFMSAAHWERAKAQSRIVARLQKSAALTASVCAGLADKTPVAGEPDPDWANRQAALREASVVLGYVAALAPTPTDTGLVGELVEALEGVVAKTTNRWAIADYGDGSHEVISTTTGAIRRARTALSKAKDHDHG